MKSYEKSTLWATGIMAILITLIVIGGWINRGYLAFDSGFLILLLSPAVIIAWYKSEKQQYEYRKLWRGRK